MSNEDIDKFVFAHWRKGTKLKDILEENRTLTEKLVSDSMHRVTEKYWRESGLVG